MVEWGKNILTAMGNEESFWRCAAMALGASYRIVSIDGSYIKVHYFFV